MLTRPLAAGTVLYCTVLYCTVLYCRWVSVLTLPPGTSPLSPPVQQSPCLTTHQLPASWDSEVISASPCTTYYLSRLTADIASTSAREVAAQGPAGLGLVSWQRWVPQQVSMAV